MQGKHQRRVARAIKCARSLGFIAGEALYEKRHVKRIREAEFRAALEQQGGVSVGEGGVSGSGGGVGGAGARRSQ